MAKFDGLGIPCGGCCTKLVDFGVRMGDSRIIEGINLHAHCGELTAIIGPNGAGKTTLLRAMLGEIPHEGSLNFVHSDGSSFGKPRIGYVPQKLDIDKSSPVSVNDLFSSVSSHFPVWLSGGGKSRSRTEKMLSLVGAANLAGMKIGELSGGQFQKVMLALALFPVPDLLLLDEPMTGMDKAGVEIFYRTVSQLRRDYHLSIFVVSHNLAEIANFADRMILMNRRILREGRPSEVLRCDEMEKAFGMSFPDLGPAKDGSAPARQECPEGGQKEND